MPGPCVCVLGEIFFAMFGPPMCFVGSVTAVESVTVLTVMDGLVVLN